MSWRATTTVALSSLLSLLVAVWFIQESLQVPDVLSPQGCRMSKMWPSYVLQSGLNSSWTPLASRYTLYLYREKEQYRTYWQPPTVGPGLPVLFIPGNAGSYAQVRSIASSAARQFYDRPQVPSSKFKDRGVRSLDFFAVDFNEDLSAFHGPTVESQIAYTMRAIDYILSLYPSNTKILVLGHSMGGVVATSLLPSPNISAIITMSTPHTLPPARFDSRIDRVYERTLKAVYSDPTPILSICGGATDMMIPSESCVLPYERGDNVGFRRTVFSSGMEGAWTGVGHREMVWCHQVRWRVARAALETGAVARDAEIPAVLDRWLRDGHTLLPSKIETHNVTEVLQLPDPNSYKVLPHSDRFELVGAEQLRESHTYLVPLPTGTHQRHVSFVLYASRGSIPPLSSDSPPSFTASIYHCIQSPVDQDGNSHPRCRGLKPNVLRTFPNPFPGKPFPAPQEGVAESEGVTLYESDLYVDSTTSTSSWIAVKVDNGDGNGWIVGGFVEMEPKVFEVSIIGLLFGGVSIPYEDHATLKSTYSFPNLLSHALLVYSINPRRSAVSANCPTPLLAPIILHNPHRSETHFHPLSSAASSTSLHSHLPAPYISAASSGNHLEFHLYSSGSAKCRIDLQGFDLTLSWSASVGRWTTRYFTALACWGIGVTLWVLTSAMGVHDSTGRMPSISTSLTSFIHSKFPILLLISFVVSFLPFPEGYYTGVQGQPSLSPIGPVLLFLATGFVCLSAVLLYVLLWLLHKVTFWISRRYEGPQAVQRSTLISMVLVCGLIFLFVPWQVAYLGSWFIQLYTCTGIFRQAIEEKPGTQNIPLLVRTEEEHERDRDVSGDESTPHFRHSKKHLHRSFNSTNHENLHVLLLMTWLLPLAAPVLVVWVRTLATAGVTTPFEGDHDFFNAVPFLVLVDFASWNQGPVLFERQRFENRISARWSLAPVIVISFLLGPRKPYLIFDVLKVAIALIVVVRIGRRYWGRPGWAPLDRMNQ